MTALKMTKKEIKEDGIPVIVVNGDEFDDLESTERRMAMLMSPDFHGLTIMLEAFRKAAADAGEPHSFAIRYLDEDVRHGWVMKIAGIWTVPAHSHSILGEVYRKNKHRDDPSRSVLIHHLAEPHFTEWRARTLLENEVEFAHGPVAREWRELDEEGRKAKVAQYLDRGPAGNLSNEEVGKFNIVCDEVDPHIRLMKDMMEADSPGAEGQIRKLLENSARALSKAECEYGASVLDEVTFSPFDQDGKSALAFKVGDDDGTEIRTPMNPDYVEALVKGMIAGAVSGAIPAGEESKPIEDEIFFVFDRKMWGVDCAPGGVAYDGMRVAECHAAGYRAARKCIT